MKIFKSVVSLLFLFVLLGTSKVELASAATATDGNGTVWVYTLSAGKATNVYTTNKTLSGHVDIPATLGGYPVVSIGSGISAGSNSVLGATSRANVTSVTIPDTVTGMDYAFRECSGLTTAPTIPNNVTTTAGTFSRLYRIDKSSNNTR